MLLFLFQVLENFVFFIVLDSPNVLPRMLQSPIIYFALADAVFVFSR